MHAVVDDQSLSLLLINRAVVVDDQS